MAKHFNALTPAEAERLALLAEEMGEAQQAVGKILRHGYESRDPTKIRSPTNRKMLEKELGDVQAAILMMAKQEDIALASVAQRRESKLVKVRAWMHHQPEPKP